MFFLASGLLSALALLSIPDGSCAQFVEIIGTGFCVDSQGQFYARGEAEKFDDPQACLDNCLRLDDLDLVGIAYKYGNKRCHCNYNVGSPVIAACDPLVFTNGCRSNKGYTGSGLPSGTNGPLSWNCYVYESTPTFTPFVFVNPTSSPETPDGGGDGCSSRILASPTLVETPVSEPTPKGTKKGSGGKYQGKRNLQTTDTVSRSPVAIFETLVPTLKGTKKGFGKKTKK